MQNVRYAGLESHPDFALAKRILPNGVGAVFSFDLVDGPVDRFVESLSLITHMTHLGDVRTLVLHPASTTHALLDGERLLAVGVSPTTLRVSVGIEDVSDLIADLEHAFAAFSAGRQDIAA